LKSAQPGRIEQGTPLALQEGVTASELRERLLDFAVQIVRLACRLHARAEGWHIARQLSAAATSAAVNYRAACRARSHREFVAKLSIALEEADETLAWLEILGRAQLMDVALLAPLQSEASELVAILATSRRTAKLRAAKITTSPNH